MYWLRVRQEFRSECVGTIITRKWLLACPKGVLGADVREANSMHLTRNCGPKTRPFLDRKTGFMTLFPLSCSTAWPGKLLGRANARRQQIKAVVPFFLLFDTRLRDQIRVHIMGPILGPSATHWVHIPDQNLGPRMKEAIARPTAACTPS